jgi:putative FmdB family regulatory protein
MGRPILAVCRPPRYNGSVLGNEGKEIEMPVYTYRCESCGVQFERQQSYTDAPLRICPECRKKTLKKVISPVGVVFKGSGFYSTDNRPSSGTSSPPPVKKEEKKEASKEAKPAKETAVRNKDEQ